MALLLGLHHCVHIRTPIECVSCGKSRIVYETWSGAKCNAENVEFGSLGCLSKGYVDNAYQIYSVLKGVICSDVLLAKQRSCDSGPSCVVLTSHSPALSSRALIRPSVYFEISCLVVAKQFRNKTKYRIICQLTTTSTIVLISLIG